MLKKKAKKRLTREVTAKVAKVIASKSPRAQKLVAEQRDALRLKFQGVAYLRMILADMKEMNEQVTNVKKARSTKANPHRASIVQSKADCITRMLKTKFDTNFKLLAKVLPDLKQVEIADPEGNNPLGTLAAALASAVDTK